MRSTGLAGPCRSAFYNLISYRLELGNGLRQRSLVVPRRQAYWQLYQLNTALGIPMLTMEALGVPPLTVSSRLPHGRARSEG